MTTIINGQGEIEYTDNELVKKAIENGEFENLSMSKNVVKKDKTKESLMSKVKRALKRVKR